VRGVRSLRARGNLSEKTRHALASAGRAILAKRAIGSLGGERSRRSLVSNCARSTIPTVRYKKGDFERSIAHPEYLRHFTGARLALTPSASGMIVVAAIPPPTLPGSSNEVPRRCHGCITLPNLLEGGRVPAPFQLVPLSASRVQLFGSTVAPD
jgi:hypothetical protein